MTGPLDGHVAVITGAATGIGRAIGDRLATAGATVVAVDVDPRDVADVRSVSAEIASAHGGVDVLIMTAAGRRATPLDVSDRPRVLTDFDDLIAANVKVPFALQRALVRAMRSGGHIVNVTTTDVLAPAGDRAPDPTTDVDAATRWALNGFTQAWALALRRHGVRVNAIAVDDDTTPERAADTLLALLAEGPDGRTGETVAADLPLPPRRARGEDIV